MPREDRLYMLENALGRMFSSPRRKKPAKPVHRHDWGLLRTMEDSRAQGELVRANGGMNILTCIDCGQTFTQVPGQTEWEKRATR